MILDSSAIVAVLQKEPGYYELLEHLNASPVRAVGAPTAAESGLVLTYRQGPVGKTLLARFLHEGQIEVLPFSEEHWGVAVDAFRRFGKGRHPAALNFGDCMTYATARLADRPLLHVGDDFPQTDLSLVR